MSRSSFSSVRSGSRLRGSGTPRNTWVALIVGVIGVLLIAGVVLGPVIGLIAAADGATGTALDVPVGRIVLALLIALVVVIALLVAAARSRRTPVPWIFVALAGLVALGASVYPLIAVAFSAVDQARDVVPFIQDLIARFGG